MFRAVAAAAKRSVQRYSGITILQALRGLLFKGDLYNITLSSRSWGIGSPVKHKKLVLTGGTAFPGCARLTCFLRTGWKAGAATLVGGAGLRARRLWWHRLPACAPHREDAGGSRRRGGPP